MDGAIASAVMLPEPDEVEDTRASPPPPSVGHKRRQLSVPEVDAKRQRLNSIDENANTNQDRRTSTSSKPPATLVPGRRERGREQRLFGAVIGALSRNSATTVQRKRTDIEKRQRARREAEEQENDQRKLERDAQRKAQRRKEQARFEKESMRIRHNNLRNMAHFLPTRAEPRLYYKPWETTSDEEARIQDQIAEAEDLIRRELAEYDDRQHAEEERERERHAGAEPSTGKEPIADAPQQPPTANRAPEDSNHRVDLPRDLGQTEDHAEESRPEAVSERHAVEPEEDTIPTTSASHADDSSKEMMDDHGEEVVEAAEDTVIY